MIILDTNVISEAMREAPDTSVAEWLDVQPAFELATTTINIAEIKFRFARLDPGRRRSQLEARFLALMAQGLGGRIFDFDAPAADVFAELAAEREHDGRRIDAFDGLIAAIALSRGASVATRDVRGFAGCGVRIINPWEADPAS